LIKKNPFYNSRNFDDDKNKSVKINEILQKINEIPNKISVNKNTEIKQIFQEILQILKLKCFFSENFKNIFTFGLINFSDMFETKTSSQYIFLLMILFLSNPDRKIIKQQKINFIKLLLKSTKEESQILPSYKGK